MSTEPRNPISPGDMFLVMADLITFRVTDAASSGRVTVVEIHVPAGAAAAASRPPAGRGLPRHRRRDDDLHG